MKTSGVNGSSGIAFLFLITSSIILQSATISAQQQASYPGLYSPLYLERQSPKYLIQTISRLRQALLNDEEMENNDYPALSDDRDTSKRGLDLGLGRGFSGSQAAKHLMGLAAANFAGGPGRRRRSADSI
ncbi:diuretic hormone class 2 isoform X2 [Diabrotica undecimpunctata]|uniref:diuretic hormone class 2 isoform X2 n=1 Tax=Diabrotica undecimpunctata TaxID=50387 RepID=UPI003B63B49F